MKRTFATFIFLFASVIGANAQITFHKTFEGRVDIGSSVKQTTDGGYIIGGNGFGGGYLIKTNAYGDTLWTKIYNGGISTHSVLQTIDGGYILFGGSYSGGAGSLDMVLLKTDTNGNLLWSKYYGDIYDNYSYNIQQTSDSGYVIAGFTDTDTTGFGTSYRSLFLIETDVAGDTMWAKTYIGDFNYCYSMQQTADGGFILAGLTYNDAFLLKTDATGIPQWSKAYGGDEAMCVKQLPDGGFIFTGKSNFFSSGDVYLVRTDINGDLLWSSVLGDSTSQRSYSIVPTNDGGYMIAGSTSGMIAPYLRDIYLLHTDSIGNLVWAKKIINSSNDDYSFCIEKTTDEGYVMSAWTLFNTPEKINLIKLDSMGNAGCSFINTLATSLTPSTIVTNLTAQIVPWNLVTGNPTWQVVSGGTVATICSSVNVNENEKPGSAFNISPNPATNKITITNPQFAIEAIEVYNLIGQKVFSQLQTENSKLQTATIDVSKWNKGIYFVKVSDGERQYAEKLVIQ
ncbi:MAG: T9SS type A sorting domain-containing protein [Bacteroidia bacterium]